MSDWVIAGEPESAMPEVHKVYQVRHSRKGVFKARILSANSHSASVEIVEGSAKFASVEVNLAKWGRPGDAILITAKLSYLIPIEDKL